VYVPSSAYEPSSMPLPSSLPNFFVSDPTLVSSSNDDSEDENPPPPAHLPPVGSIEHELAPAPPLPKWVRTTQETVGDLIGDPIDQRRTRSQFQ
jgi:hypothetical protein